MSNDPKPGFKSTEFWLMVAIAALVAFGPKLGIELSSEQITNLLIVGGIYTGGRAAPKAAAAFGRK